MHDMAFADASRPRPVFILCLRMRDYSIGHELLLLAHRNPLLCLSAGDFSKLPPVNQRAAIIEAADICCQTWEEYHSVPRGWREKWRLRRIWKKWGRVLRKAVFEIEVGHFLKYRAAANADLPMAKMPRQSGTEYRAFGQPEMAGLLNFLEIKCGYSREESRNFALGAARMRHLAWLESIGSVRIANEDEVKHKKEAEAWAAAHPENTLVMHPKD